MSYSTGVRHKEGVTQEGPMIEERLTEDLLARLLAAPNPDSYLGEGLTLQRSLADYLHELLAAKGLKRADVYRASGLNSTVVSMRSRAKADWGATMRSWWRSGWAARCARPSGF